MNVATKASIILILWGVFLAFLIWLYYRITQGYHGS